MEKSPSIGWKVIIFCLLLPSCVNVGPDYVPPPHCISDQWAFNDFEEHIEQDLPEENFFTEEEPFLCWWRLFNDPLLNKYTEMAWYYNNDLKAAEANICRARALIQVAAAPLFPMLSADLNGTRTYFSKNGPLFAVGAQGGTASGRSGEINGPSPTSISPFTAQVPQLQNLYNATFDATWEIDFFGKTRRNIEASKANFESIIEQRNDVLISVLAEVARNYINVRSAQELLELTKKNIQLLEKNTDLIADRVKAGLTNHLDLERIRADLATAQSNLPNIESQIFRGIYAIAALTGGVPECLIDEILPQHPLPTLPLQIDIGLRSDLLRRRPDVRKAERQLAYATANIGVAAAAFYPTFTLLGDIGFQSLQLNNLFSGSSLTWSYGADLNIPIFQGGKLVGNLKASEAATAEALFSYQQVVLDAVKEAESDLVTLKQEMTTSKLLGISVEQNHKVYELTISRYKSGLVGIIDLLDSERQVIANEENLLNSKTAALVDLVALYKSLGGGWKPFGQDCCE